MPTKINNDDFNRLWEWSVNEPFLNDLFEPKSGTQKNKNCTSEKGEPTTAYNAIMERMGLRKEERLKSEFQKKLEAMANSKKGLPQLAYEIYNLKDKFVLEVLLPGRTKDDFQVKLESCGKTQRRKVVISAENTRTEEDLKENGYVSKFHQSKASFECYLPENIVEDDLKTSFEGGLLALTFPLKQLGDKKETRFIEIG